MTPSKKIPSQDLKSIDITKAKEELAIAKAKFGQTRPTKRELDELAGRLPETPAFLKEMFLLYGKAMAFDRMEQLTEKLLALDPSDADIRFRLIDTAIEHKNSGIFSRNAWSVARSHLDAAQKDPKLTVTAWLKVADCYLRIDEPELALGPAQNAVELADVTQIAASRLKLVEVMIHLSQTEDARSELDQLRDKSLTPLETLRFAESFEKLLLSPTSGRLLSPYHSGSKQCILFPFDFH